MSLSIGYSAIRANQVAMETISNNIANAGTEGYHRQVVDMRNRLPVEIANLQIGTGVDVVAIRRMQNLLVERAVTDNVSELGDINGQLEILERLEHVFTPGTGSLHGRVEEFFAEMERLAALPEDPIQKDAFVRAATVLAEEFQSVEANLARLKVDAQREIEGLVAEANDLATAIADLNVHIRLTETRGVNANDLRDQRDQLLNRLAEYVDVRLVEEDNGLPLVYVGDGALMISQEAAELQVAEDADGNLMVNWSGWEKSVDFHGGRIAGLLTAHNDVITDFQTRLESLAVGLMSAVDSVHARGISTNGPFERLFGQRTVDDPTVPLNDAGLQFPMQAGNLFVSVTDTATGNRTTTAIAIDPATDSLNDVAAAISGIANVQAVVDPQTNLVSMVATPGYTFDFAGRLDTAVDTSLITGTAAPHLSGLYTGSTNDTYTFEVVSGSGTVGVTDGLTVRVRNGAGQDIAFLDVGQSYEPGTTIEIANGIRVAFDSGTFNTGDTFSSEIVGTPDTTGFLVSMGLNTLFTGTNASDMEVSKALANDPTLLALTLTGDEADTSNLQKLLALRDTRLMDGNVETFEEYLASATSKAGDHVQDLTIVREDLELLGERLTVERERFAGVDPNEELVRLMQHQRAFQAASRTMTVVVETINSLMDIVR